MAVTLFTEMFSKADNSGGHLNLWAQILYNAMNFFKWKLNMKLQMKYLQKDNWAQLLNCWHANNWSYKILHVQR